MKWNLISGKYTAKVQCLDLTAVAGDLGHGVLVTVGDTPIVRAFAFDDSDYRENARLTYSRGTDIFTIFENENRTAECYWRISNPFAPWVCLESIISLRSSKLSSESLECSLSVANEKEGLRFLENPVGFLNDSNPCCWFIFAHPDDKHEVSINRSSSGANISIHVPQLERGVIRRIRIQLAMCVETSHSNEIEKIVDYFGSSEIPLTT